MPGARSSSGMSDTSSSVVSSMAAIEDAVDEPDTHHGASGREWHTLSGGAAQVKHCCSLSGMAAAFTTLRGAAHWCTLTVLVVMGLPMHPRCLPGHCRGCLPFEGQAEFCGVRRPGTCQAATGLSATERQSVSDRRARPSTTGCPLSCGNSQEAHMQDDTTAP